MSTPSASAVAEKRTADTMPFALMVILLATAFLFGGGGSRFGIANLVVQLAGLGVLAFRRDSFVSFWRESPLGLRILVAAALALPLLQIIPLPESLWTALPNRTLVQRSLDLAGGPDWMAFSVDPRRTLLALTALITPLAVLTAGWTLPRERLLDLAWVVVAMGVVTVLMAPAQLGAATDATTFFGSRNPGEVLLGTLGGRNATALLLVFTLAFAAVLPAPRPHPAVLPVRLAICTLLLVGVFLTQSRTGVVLALLPVLLGTIRALAALRASRRDPRARRNALLGAGAIALVAFGVGALAVSTPGRIATALERFEARDDPRRFIWEDAVYVAGQYWPAGAGTGTFDEIYQIDESLENLTLRKAGRAHNDYIELVIESGGLGIALAALWAWLIVWLSLRARDSSLRWVAWGSSACLLAVALQSITDYPLRNHTMFALAGFALLLLTRTAVPLPSRSER